MRQGSGRVRGRDRWASAWTCGPPATNTQPHAPCTPTTHASRRGRTPSCVRHHTACVLVLHSRVGCASAPNYAHVANPLPAARRTAQSLGAATGAAGRRVSPKRLGASQEHSRWWCSHCPLGAGVLVGVLCADVSRPSFTSTPRHGGRPECVVCATTLHDLMERTQWRFPVLLGR